MVVFVCTSLVDILLPVCSAKLNLVKVAICSKAMMVNRADEKTKRGNSTVTGA